MRKETHNSKTRDEESELGSAVDMELDMELADWLRRTARELRQSASLPDDRATDPFSDPVVRARVARLIARAAARSQEPLY